MFKLRLPFVRLAIVSALLALTQAVWASPTDPNFVRVPATSTRPQTGTITVDPLHGGRLTVGRYSLRIPIATIKGKAKITLSVPDPSKMQCELFIDPPSANGFLVPMVLEANVSGAKNVNLLLLRTVTRDEKSGIWALVPQISVNVANQTVITPLLHFSKYGIVEGKAGW